MSSEFLDREIPAGAAGIVVARPRSVDAIGEALRDAFGNDFGLPDDMMNCLRALDMPQCARRA